MILELRVEFHTLLESSQLDDGDVRLQVSCASCFRVIEGQKATTCYRHGLNVCVAMFRLLIYSLYQ